MMDIMFVDWSGDMLGYILYVYFFCYLIFFYLKYNKNFNNKI